MRIRFTLALALILILTTTAIAQDDDESMMDGTTFTVRIENVSAFPAAVQDAVTDAGTFAVTDTADAPGPATPGQQYTFEISANPGDVFTFATMWAQSNDAFYSTSEAGIPLYDDNDAPISGSVRDQIVLYDLGTEVNEEPGVGENQAPRQPEPNTGEVENSVVLPIAEVEDGYEYRDIIDVIIEPSGENTFTVTIANIDDGTADFPGVLSPGVYIVHSPDASAPLFTVGERDYGLGLEQIAEDGPPAQIGLSLSGDIATPISPGVYVVHTDPGALFTIGSEDAGQGLEAIAEDGAAGMLGDTLAETFATAGVFNTPTDMEEPGPVFPGQAYEFTVTAVPGEVLSFATMYVQTNDIIFAPGEPGIALFDDEGNPINGDVTDQVLIIDVGTEVNEPIGEGENQAPRQSGPNTGEDENGVVSVVTEFESDVPTAASNFIRVIVAPDDMMMDSE